jgi:hypothetical protein
MKQQFNARLMSRGPGGAWTYLPIPFDVQQVFGSKSRVAVAGTMNGFPFRSSLLPEGDGTHSMMVNKEMQVGANVRAGDVVSISLQLDQEVREVIVPVELEQALLEDEQAASVFAGLAYSHKKEYVDWISSAKQPATKARRVVKAVSMLAAGTPRLR